MRWEKLLVQKLVLIFWTKVYLIWSALRDIIYWTCKNQGNTGINKLFISRLQAQANKNKSIKNFHQCKCYRKFYKPSNLLNNAEHCLPMLKNVQKSISSWKERKEMKRSPLVTFDFKILPKHRSIQFYNFLAQNKKTCTSGHLWSWQKNQKILIFFYFTFSF